MSNTPELSTSERTPSPESHEAAAEQLEKLSKNLEHAGEHLESGEKSADRARDEAPEQAISVESGGKEKLTRLTESSPAARRGSIGKAQKEASFKRTMKHVQAELSPSSRAFSKVIHTKAIEQTSEVLGATIARPNAMLAGSVSAFLLTLGVYVLAKTLGYQLSGFETIGAFIAGWVIGIVYDYLRVLITGKKY